MSGLIHYFILAVLFCNCSSVLAQIDEIFDRLEYLQTEVQRLRLSESNVQTLESKVQTLESKVKSLESEVQYSRKENEVLRYELRTSPRASNINRENLKGSTMANSTKARRLIGSDIIPELVPSATAFSAVITPNFDRNIGPLHVFVYDHVVCNLGGAYNNSTGIFTTPRSGIYAFLWNIVAEGSSGQSSYGEIGTELLVNSKPKGRVDADTEVASDDDQSTGFVIVQLNQGDVVYVRSSNKNAVQGVFQKNLHGGWTFSGWQIA